MCNLIAMMEAKLTMKVVLSPKKDIRFVAVIISLIFSCIVLAYNQPTNGDAIVYFRSAIAYGEGGISAALYYYGWPFFSLLLHYITSFTHISLLNAGLLLNTILCALLVWGFISIIKALGGNYRMQCIAAMIILIYPYINHFRDNILRDMGYWAFYIVAMLYIIRFSNQRNWRNAILWNIAIGLATLFRIEGVIFAAFAPLFILFDPSLRFSSRIGNCLKLYSLPILIVLIGLIAILVIGDFHFLQSSRINEVLVQIQLGGSKSLNVLQTAASQASTYILNYYARHNSMAFVLGGLFTIFCTQIIINLGPVYSVLALHGVLKQRMQIKWNGKAIITSFTVINLMLFAWFMSQRLFISKRYTTGLALLLLIFVVYSVASILEKPRRKRSITRSCAIFLVAIALCYNLIGGLGHFGTNKSYIVKAGKWLKENSSSEDPIYSNTVQVFLYTERTGNNAWDIDLDRINAMQKNGKNGPDALQFNLIQNQHVFKGQTEKFISTLLNSPTQYDYLVLELSRHHDNEIAEKLEGKLDVEKVKTFQNKKGDRVYIYKVVD